MKHLTYISSILLAAAVFADPADPQISNVRLNQNGVSRRVTVKYDLDEAAVVTMDVLTNGVSIGGENIQAVGGDCFKKVAAGNNHVVTWDPHLSWPDHKFGAGIVSVRMTAWALDNTPDYMAVDISATGGAGKQTYYPAADFVPGGVANGIYKTTTLLMRKIMAKDVTWTMGTAAESGRDATRETPHQVTLTNNYYIGIYPVTQTQWQQITGYNPSAFTTDRAMRPVEKVSYTDIRQGKGTASTVASATDTDGVYPAEPYSDSFLGLLRAKTSIDFDLPSEAQWEFAARAGNGEGYWGDGSAMRISSNMDVSLDLLGRYQYNGGKIGANSGTDPAATCEAANGTAIVGSYRPNDWGLYDMHGNVFEWCLDWYADDITALNGTVNTVSGAYRMARGGSWNFAANICRPAYRYCHVSTLRISYFGFRVACTAGLQ